MSRVWALGLVALLSACASKSLPPATDASLYRDLGERAGIQHIVEGMLINIASDKRIAERFRNVDIVRLRNKLVEQFCVESGGPCTYTGADMAEAHKGQEVGRAQFNALVEDLIKAMDARQVSVPVQNRLLARLAAMRAEVIEK